ncbi:MAG: putative toxin-antitoxin system toxin component, PIN family [Gemmatimonadota bacterium]|nr:putative toxin-antitoxin system toxin component, PIN family [Gemmatimonadota bacterium]
MRIVLDTNVVVSGLLSALGPPGGVIESVFAGEVTPLYDDRILAEYAAVLARPRFRFDAGDVEWFMTAVRMGEGVLAPPLAVNLPDPSDLKFVEVAVAGGADAIVAGNLRDFRLSQGKLAVAILSPRALMDRLR